MDVPNGSIYKWMYIQGLKHVDFDQVVTACMQAGKTMREKDAVNYWNGWHNSVLYHGPGADDIFNLSKHARRYKPPSDEFFKTRYQDYAEHPFIDIPYEVENRWVPCSASNKPLIKWGNGCMSLVDACSMREQVYLAENLKGCKFIVIDCDGDHDAEIDMETVSFLYRYSSMTHLLAKPKLVCDYEGYEMVDCTVPASFHLTFMVDRIIPTMHFPEAHIDIVGNRRNSLRYFKNKMWNGRQPIAMTDEIWRELQQYIEYRKEAKNVNELA